MLILSRRAEQEILFPHLGIRINVLQVKGQLVKLGVDAPKAISVIRSELADKSQPPGQEESFEKQLDHQQRNELNLLNLKIQSIQSRIDRGEQIPAQQVLDSLVEPYSNMDHSFAKDHSAAKRCDSDRPIRLLVVEDCDNERQLMAYLLASHGFDVQVAPDGQLALSQLKQGDRLPDFVLMDMQMPHSDGLQTLMEIRSSEALQHLKVFAVTGLKRDPQHEPIGRSWDGWFRKPLDVHALVNRLHEELPSEPAVLQA